MKKYLLVTILFFVFASCDYEAKENYKNAANAMCECIEKQKEYDKNTVDFSNDIMHYAICSFDVEHDFSISCSDDGFEKALEKACPELMEAHLKVKDNYQQDYE
jgi:hypothetical protein